MHVCETDLNSGEVSVHSVRLSEIEVTSYSGKSITAWTLEDGNTDRD